MSLIDFEFLFEIADGDPSYICDVIDIFLDTVPPGIDNLEKLINETDDWDAIHKQAHTLKSSLGIVRIGNLLPQMAGIELNAQTDKDKANAQTDINSIVATFKEAQPLLLAEKAKYELKKGQG